MTRHRRTLASIAVLVVVLLGSAGCSDGSDAAGDASGNLVEFCKIMEGPPPTRAFRDPSDAAARNELDNHVAGAEAVAPKDIREQASTYRQSVRVYLEGRADTAGGNSSAVEEAQRHQARAASAINEYVDRHCPFDSTPTAAEHHPVGELASVPALAMPGWHVLVGPGDGGTICVKIDGDNEQSPSCQEPVRVAPGAEATLVLAFESSPGGDRLVGLAAPEIVQLIFKSADGSTVEAKLAGGVFAAVVDTSSVKSIAARTSDRQLRCERLDSPLFQFTCEP